MKPNICQSCGFPFTSDFAGTNRDHSLSTDYCRGCFKEGEYTDHHLTIQELERRYIEMAREHDEISLEEARQVINTLPDLKRWRMTHIL